MMMRALRFGPLLVFALTLSVVVAATASTAVPSSKAGTASQTRTVAQLTPSQCTSVPTNLVTGAGTVAGGLAADLVLGSPGIDSLTGQASNDCLVAGGGNDNLRGDGGTDVCIGGPGTDIFHNSCETQVQ
jgi:Ca2+-binding RTX toxin-like protein